eukprot:4638411-Pyramimonas_sp.AAC.1
MTRKPLGLLRSSPSFPRRRRKPVSRCEGFRSPSALCRFSLSHPTPRSPPTEETGRDREARETE